MPLAYAKNGKIRRNNTKILCDGQTVEVLLYGTRIFYYDRQSGHVILFTGGWNTPTTRRRMNECLHAYELRLPDGSSMVGRADFRDAQTLEWMV